MKKSSIILTIGLFLLMFFAFSFTNYATDGEAEAVIVFQGGEYVAYSGDEPILSSASLEALIGGLTTERVRLDSLSITEPLAIRRDLVISGDFSCSADLTVERGSVVTLCSATVTLSSGASIRVRGGALTLEGTYISADSVAVRTEAVDSSHFTMISGECTSSSACALEITRGTATLLGGSIKGKAQTAVMNSGTLNICDGVSLEGQAYDVKSTRPVYSTDGSIPKDFSLMMDQEFGEGEMHLCVIDAVNFTGGVRIFDGNGKEQSVKFFESYRGILEKNLVCVYKPYKIDLVVEGVRESVYALRGEVIEERQLPDKTGYSPRGWFLDSTLQHRYDFSVAVEGSFSLYAGYSLLPPTFTLEDFSKEYDGTPATVGFKSLTHPLLDSGITSYKWYSDADELVSEGECLTLTNVDHSGEYYCNITFSHGRDTVEVRTPRVAVTITRGIVKAPTIAPLVYNGVPQYPSVPYSALYTVSSFGYIDAGEYTLTLTLNDYDNYRWEGSDEKSITVVYRIAPDENAWLTEFSVSDTYFGAELSPSAISKYGEAVYLYSSSENGAYSLTPPTAPGHYYVKAVVEGSRNYLALESAPVFFEILAELPVSVTVATEPYRTAYSAFDLFDGEGMTLSVLYNSGRRAVIDARIADFSYQSGSCFLFTDNAVIVEYMGCRTLQPVTVSRIDYLHTLTLDDLIATYDGAYHTTTPSGKAPIGNDGIPLSYRVVGGGIDAGEYEIKLEFFSDSINYNIPEPLFATLTVLPLVREVIWSTDKFVYDGSVKCPTAYFVNEYGAGIPLFVVGGGIYAGENYRASVTSPSVNYAFENSELAFTVDKAVYDMSGVRWSERSFTYCGEELSVYISNLPSGVSVTGYVGASGVKVGNYSARVSFAYDTANYYEPTLEPYSWSIERAEYDLSGFSFEGYSFVYDSAVHYPILNGTMPIGIDGIELSYSFSGGVTNVSEGVRVIEVKFTTDSENYRAPQPIYVEIYATPQPIFVTWDNLTLTYTGNLQAPIATSELCELKVTADAVNAGKYTATAHSQDSNYEVVNAECEFEILKAENAWLELPSCPDMYETKSPSPVGEVLFGECEYKFYTDIELTNEAELPLTVGEYYCIVYVSEGDNYFSLYSEPIKFTVIKVVPISLECVLLNTELFAFESVGEGDVSVLLHLNDGSTRALALSEVSLSYGEEDSLRAGEENLVFCYGELSFTLPVAVKKASFDLSGVIWSALSYTYDGTSKLPYLLNLPEGLKVREYIGTGGVDIGEYTIGAVFDYDTENYEAPILPTAVMVIKPPATVPNGRDEVSARIYILISVFLLLFGLMLFVLIRRREAFIAYLGRARKGEKHHLRINPSDKIDNVGSVLSVNTERADELISDSLAKTLIRKNPITFKTGGTRRAIINVDTISAAYESGSIVDINSLKEKGLIDSNVCYIKVLGRGTVDKPLKIFANSFSLNAVKMIALTGGEANKIQAKRLK